MMSKRDKVHTGRRPASARPAAGFTLVELMVTLAVLIILLAIGVPQMRTFLLKRQVTADIENLSSAFSLARSEALKRSGRVSICPLAANSTNCAAAATRDWSNGWMVFIDEPDGDGGFGPNDTQIRIEQGTRSGSLNNTSSLRKLSFEGNGLLNNQAGTFSIHPINVTDASACKGLRLNRQGRLGPATCPTETPQSGDSGG